MATKAELSSTYTDRWLALTKDAERPTKRTAIVIGTTGKPGVNIGDTISSVLSANAYGVISNSTLDATDAAAVEDFMHNYARDTDTLVVSCGHNEMAWFEDSIAHKHVLEVNLLAPYYLAQEFVHKTIHDHSKIKTIVFVGSMAYNHVLNASAMYCASKAGLAHLTAALGWELTPKGYRVFCVHPSNVEHTPMTQDTIKGIMKYRGVDRETAEAYWGAVRAMPGWLRKQDVAQTVLHLCSGAADFQSGAQIELRGGQR